MVLRSLHARARAFAARPSALHFGLAFVVLTLSCVTGVKAPNVAPNGTLGLRGLDASSADSGPLAVVYASPQGELRGPSEITILFSKPMRALDLAGDEAPFPGRIEPAVKGQWQWVGTRAASFIPARPDSPGVSGGGSFRLLAATSYTVTIPKGTRSVDGDTLAEDYTFSFSTERPSVVSTSPWNDYNDLEPDSHIEVRFNQPVSDAEILRAGHLEASGQAIPFEVKRDDAQNLKQATLVPRALLPLDAPVRLTIDASLKGAEGPLPMGQEDSYAFRTYGPLAVEGVTCNDSITPHGKCDPTSGVTVSLTNPVKFKDLKKAISVDGLKLAWPSYYSDDETVSSITLGARFAAAQSYAVHVSTPLKDVHGQSLDRAFSKSIKFDDYWPLAQIGMSDGVFEAKTGNKQPTVASVNANDLQIVTARLSEDDVLELENDQAGVRSARFDSVKSRAGAKEHTPQKGVLNRVSRETLSASDILGGAGAKGPFAIAIKYGSGRGEADESRSIAQITDLAITAKVSRAGTMVWVTRLSDGSMVSDATVKIRRPGEAGVSAKTDAQGFATFSPTEFRPSFRDDQAIIFASTADDTSFKPVNDNLENWSFSADEDALFGMMFSDRGIYRPGDTMRLKGIVREEVWNGTSTPGANHRVHVDVSSTTGDKVFSGDANLSAFGTFAFDVPLPRTGSLGTYEVSAVLDPEQSRGSLFETFEVAEYRPVEFEVHAESDRPSYTRGDAASWTGRGDFLFGAPMSGAQVSTYVSREKTYFTPDDTDGFVVGDDAYYDDLPNTTPRESVVTSADGKLDPKGATNVKATLAMPGQLGPEAVTCSVDVTDLSRQQVSTSTTAIVHPAEYYVGVSLDDRFVDVGTTLKPGFIAVTPKGERLAGRPIEIELVRRKWVVSKQANGGSSFSTQASVVDTTVGTCKLTSARAPVACDLKPNEGGYYVLHATSKDARGNPVGASIGIYATGSGGGGWFDSDKTDLGLVTDKERYSVGDKARILVKSPFASADALVTVERGGIYSKKIVKLAGGAPTIEVPITEDMRPNAYVSVMVLRGRSRPAPAKPSDPDVGAPAFKLGFAQLTIDPEKKRLHVAVKPSKTDLRPGEEITVDVDVTDAGGKPAESELTLYAVDEGVLSLVGYKTPDPIPVFAAPRSLKVATVETRSGLATLFDPLGGLGGDKGLAGGGGDAGGATAARKDFRASAYFNPSLVTDEKGHASATFKLPDGLTTYRVMAVAVAKDDRFGYADKRVTTSQPLMARPAFPRFLRAGDSFEAGVIVTSKGASGDVDVAMTATGVSTKGEPAAHVHLAQGESVEVRFPMIAETAGTASFRFDVKGGGFEDHVELSREVEVPMVLEAVALYGNTSSESAEKLGDLGAIRSDAGELTMSMSSSALVGLDGAADQLLDYPYGCSEQLTSRLVPIVNMRDLADTFHLPMPKNVDDVVDKTVSKLLTHQQASGGFGLWPDSPKANIWVTAYAYWGLQEAKHHGATVPDQSLTSAADYMRREMSELDDEDYGPAAQTFVVDVLAEYDTPDPGRISTLFERRKDLPLFAKALLLHAMVSAKSDADSIASLSKEIEASIRLDGPIAKAVDNVGDGYIELLDSETRTSALVLRGLLAANPKHPLGAALAMGLLANRQGSAWRTTQETAWSLIALGDYRKAQEVVEPDFDANVFIGDEQVVDTPFRGRSLATTQHVVPASKLASIGGATLGFSVEGKGKLFYEARLRYARKVLPTDVIDRGFFVEKRLRKVTPDTLGAALDTVPTDTALSFQGGDLVLADLVVVTPEPRDFVVIDDALPAGFEAVDTRLATTSGRLDVDHDSRSYGESDEANDREELSSWYRREIHDDRVLFFADHLEAGVYRYRYLARATSLGTFVVPPTKAEEMYTPEVFGRTGSSSIAVAP